jgi:hypothetical protein
MVGTVEKIDANVRQWESTAYGKKFEVDMVTVDGVVYEYNRQDTYKPFIVGTKIEFNPEKNKWGKDKMSGPKIIEKVGAGPQRPQDNTSAPVQAFAPKTNGVDVRIAALNGSLHFFTTYKKASTTTENILELASEFEEWLLKGSKGTPSAKVENNVAPAAAETPQNDVEDDLPF